MDAPPTKRRRLWKSLQHRDGDQEQMTMRVHEVEYFQHEDDLLKKKEDCQKNPGHLDFIAAPDFKRRHLPRGYRDSVWWDYVQTVISLTVRLVVGYTSSERPDGYADALMRGSCWGRVGTGMVERVYREFTEEDGETCPCTECHKKSPDQRKTKWGGFMVDTALHVVFNDEESQYSRCDVGFDRDEDRDKCSKLYGVGVWHRDFPADRCEMYCVTHDENVYRKMAEMVRAFEDLQAKILDKYVKTVGLVDMLEVPVVCVSHPHGMSKHVTVGVVAREVEIAPLTLKWCYTAQTCGGSSGAPVFTLVRWVGKYAKWRVQGHHSIHSGCNQAGENQCDHSGLDWLV